jgi:hypothetical protein
MGRRSYCLKTRVECDTGQVLLEFLISIGALIFLIVVARHQVQVARSELHKTRHPYQKKEIYERIQ